MRSTRKAQNWTIDLLVGVVIFMSIAIFFYTIARANLDQQTSFDDSADALVEKLNAENYPDNYNNTPLPLSGYTIQETEIKQLYQKNYSTVKRQLNIQGDFCLTVVNSDGSLVSFNVSGNPKYSFGSGDGNIMVGPGIACGE